MAQIIEKVTPLTTNIDPRRDVKSATSYISSLTTNQKENELTQSKANIHNLQIMMNILNRI